MCSTRNKTFHAIPRHSTSFHIIPHHSTPFNRTNKHSNEYSDFQASCNEKASSVKRQASRVADYHVSTTAVNSCKLAHAALSTVSTTTRPIEHELCVRQRMENTDWWWFAAWTIGLRADIPCATEGLLNTRYSDLAHSSAFHSPFSRMRSPGAASPLAQPLVIE